MKKYYVNLTAFDYDDDREFYTENFTEAQKIFDEWKKDFSTEKYIYLVFEVCKDTSDYRPVWHVIDMINDN